MVRCHTLLILLLFLGPGCGPKETPHPQPDAGPDAAMDARIPDAGPLPDTGPPPDAAPLECGNGVVEGDEVCDDGNRLSGDGCNSTCTLNDDWDLVANASHEGDQREPALACGGSTVALVFSDWSGVDGSGAAVRLRFFGTDGLPLPHAGGSTGEFTVNLATAGHQDQPRVALLSNGNFVVVWRSASPGGSEVKGRVLSDNGGTVSGELSLASDPTGEQGTPAVTADASDGFLAVWADNRPGGPDGSSYGIRGRLFDNLGQPRVNAQTGDSGDFQVNQVTANAQFQPDVGRLGTGFLVVWTDGSGALDSDGHGVVATLIDRDGQWVGPGTDFLVNSTTAGLQASPRVGPQPGAGAVVVWTDDSGVGDLSSYGVRARLLDSNGAPRLNGQTMTAGDFPINTTYPADQMLPTPAALSDGRFVVAWQDWSGQDGSGAGIRARLFTATGAPVATPLSPLGDDFQINTTFWGSQLTPALCTAESWFIAMWEDQSGQPPDDVGAAVRFRLLPGP